MIGTGGRAEGEPIDVRRIGTDPAYRNRKAVLLLERSGDRVDHVELRRSARRVFPELGRPAARDELALLVGAASTLQRSGDRGRDGAGEIGNGAGVHADGPESRDGGEPSIRLDYPEEYTALEESTKNVLIRFCDRQLEDGRQGKEALERLRDRYGWPYTPRTFYVGPWKAARLRRRKREKRRAAREAAQRHRGGPRGPRVTRAGVERPRNFPPPPEPGDSSGIELVAPNASYSAQRVEDGQWEVVVRARVDRPRMLKLHAQALELFIPPEELSTTAGSRKGDGSG